VGTNATASHLKGCWLSTPRAPEFDFLYDFLDQGEFRRVAIHPITPVFAAGLDAYEFLAHDHRIDFLFDLAGAGHALPNQIRPRLGCAATPKKTNGLGAVAFDQTAEWDQQKQNNLLSAPAARGYSAFGVFGVSPTDINATFTDLKSQGFPVVSLGSCPAGDKDEADFCLSTGVRLAAYKAAKAAIGAVGGHGVLVHLTGNNVDANTQLRILQSITDIDIDTDLQTAQKAVSDLMADKGDRITGIVATAYNPAVADVARPRSGPGPWRSCRRDSAPCAIPAYGWTPVRSSSTRRTSRPTTRRGGRRRHS
jgi:hypothetical protein